MRAVLRKLVFRDQKKQRLYFARYSETKKDQVVKVFIYTLSAILQICVKKWKKPTAPIFTQYYGASKFRVTRAEGSSTNPKDLLYIFTHTIKAGIHLLLSSICLFK